MIYVFLVAKMCVNVCIGHVTRKKKKKKNGFREFTNNVRQLLPKRNILLPGPSKIIERDEFIDCDPFVCLFFNIIFIFSLKFRGKIKITK